MADAAVKTRRRRLAEWGALAGAVAAAAVVGVVLFVSAGGGDDGSIAASSRSPEDTVRALYDAVGKGDANAFNALLVPELRGDEASFLIPFGDSLGAVQVGGSGGVAAPVSSLALKQTNDSGGWSSVHANGLVTLAGQQKSFEETVFLQKVSGAWLVSNEAAFQRSFTTPQPGNSGNVDLGPLEPQRPEVGKPAPNFALIDARDGATVRKLSDFAGKAVVVNWYASWCGPCQQEIPDFQAAQTALDGQVVFLGVDYLEDAGSATSILDEHKATYPAVLDSEGKVADHYRVNGGLPVTFVVDKDGVLRAMHTGQVTPDTLAEMLKAAGVSYAPAGG